MDKFEVQIPRRVYQKIMHWINKTDIEVSGFGKCVLHPNGVVQILDAYLIKQEGGAAHTDIDAAALGKLMYQTKDIPGELRYWWHSHVNMPVFWSGQDTNTIKELGSQDWIVATVFNKKYEMKSAICWTSQHELMGKSLSLKEEIPSFIMDPKPTPQEIEQWDKDFTDNVTEEKKYQYLSHSSWRQWDESGYEGSGRIYQPGNNGSLIDITKEFHKKEDKVGDPAWDRDDQRVSEADVNKQADEYFEMVARLEEEGLDQGLYGYGIPIEAKGLGMTSLAYARKLAQGDKKQTHKLADKLERMIDNGKLDRIWNDFYGIKEPASDKTAGSNTNAVT